MNNAENPYKRIFIDNTAAVNSWPQWLRDCYPFLKDEEPAKRGIREDPPKKEPKEG